MTRRVRLGVFLAYVIGAAFVQSAPAFSAKVLSARGWAHTEFGRLVFEWDSRVRYQASIRNRTLQVRFESPVTMELGAVRRTLSRYIRTVSISRDRKTITAGLTGDYGLRHLANANIVIVDLLAPVASAPPRVKSGANATRLSVRTGQHARFGRLVFDWDTGVEYKVSRSGASVVIRFNRSATLDTSRLRSNLPDQIRGASARSTRTGLEVRLVVAPKTRVRHFRDTTKVVVDIIGAAVAPTERTKPRASPASSKSGKSGQSERNTANAVTPAERNRAANGGQSSGKSAGKEFRPLVSVDVTKQPGKVTVRFNWRKSVAAAAYTRGNKLWILFDRAARIDLGGIKIAGRGVITAARQVKTQKTAWISLTVRQPIKFTLERNRTAWVLDLNRGKKGGRSKLGAAVRVDRGRGADSKVVVGLKAEARPHRYLDPDAGDELFVFATTDPTVGMPVPSSFVEFELLKSAAGIVIRKKADSVMVRAKKKAIEITARNGLILSPDADVAKPRAKVGVRIARPPLSHIKDWYQGDGGDTAHVEQQLIDAIIKAPGPKRNVARMDLGRFYLANQMPGAAIGVLNIVRKQDLSYERDLDFRALRGAASYLLGHFSRADSDLNFSYLKQESSVSPWRAAVSAARGDWKEAHRRFKGVRQVLQNYPAWLASQITLVASEAALAVGELKLAKNRLKTLRAGSMTSAQRLHSDYLRAFLSKKEGNIDQALSMWRKLSKSRDRMVRAKAAFAVTETLLETGKIKIPKAIEGLERLTYSWRGDAFEFDLLRRLGDLYSKQQDHRFALTRYRQAASYFDSVKGTEAMTEKMSKLFNELYLNGGADSLPVVRALALYEEFRELTPPGELGDKMIRKLADRLAAVDLLDQAAELLEHQVEFRVQGPLKARVGARLAHIRLLDLKPLKAIEALKNSEIVSVPAVLRVERSLIKARALNQLGKSKQALGAIAGQNNREAEVLRVAIHWRKSQWRQAARALGRILKDSTDANMTQENMQFVLQRGVALVLARDTKGLAQLRNRFGNIMKGSPNAEAFEAIAGRTAKSISDYKTLAKAAGDPTSFEKFMTTYRDRLKALKESSVN